LPGRPKLYSQLLIPPFRNLTESHDYT